MPYAVVTYFDPPTERAVRAIWDDLAARGISRDVPAAQIRPHITLAVYDDLDCLPCEEHLAVFQPALQKLKIRVDHVGVFFNPRAVLFLAPSVTMPLLEFHAQVHANLEIPSGKSWKIYRPGRWVPHCTLAIDLETGKLEKAMTLCAQLKFPMILRADSLGAVEFVPADDLFQHDLKNG
jgi:2'-5' RNA ligase